ncbi:MAG: biotin-dependent carboxyltransferase family protein [Alphaproteobacteria bacterium]
MTALLVRDCGAGTTLQDGGRFGYQRFGVGPAGAMDRIALSLANMLVGNPETSAAIEFIALGGSFEVEGGSFRVALAGAGAALSIDGEAVPPLTSATVRAGQIVTVGPAKAGTSMILAVSGGFDVPADLGSRAFHLRAGLGGINRGPIRSGQRLAIGDVPNGEDMTFTMTPTVEAGAFRVVLGPQDDYFSAVGVETFLSSTYTITAEADRMGYRLTGPQVEHAKGFNIVSDGIVTGSVQIPGSGEPIVLLADRQTTGGYPKIATIISSDLPRFGQQRPGGTVQFRAVSIQEATKAARDLATMMSDVKASLVPVGRGLTSERLLSVNLIDGWVSAAA